MEDFVHLHVHTYYSILDGQSSIKRLVDKAISDGMKGMAITDHGDMFGIKEFHDICNGINKQRKKDGLEPFKPIFGCEMYVARRGDMHLKETKDDLGGYHLIVLAKNANGYKNLIKLVSNSWVDGFYNRPRTDRTELEKYHEDLIVCSACIAGEVPAKILRGDIAGARESIEWHQRLWGDDYYLELQRHEVTDPNQRANRETFPLQQQANKVLIELAREYGIKLVCTNDAHFVDKENAEAHDHLLCLSTGKDLDDPTRMLYSKQECPSLKVSELKMNGGRSLRSSNSTTSLPLMRMARTNCLPKKARRKSRSWVATIRSTESSLKLTIWQNWPMPVPSGAMATRFQMMWLNV